jgi:predicted Zn-dependent protease with MMP-like domain
MNPKPNSADEKLIDEAFAALDDGDAARALHSLAKCRTEHPLRFVAEGAARFALDDLSAARAALDRAMEIGLGDDELDGLWLQGDLLLREWRIEDAEATFERIAEIDESAEICDRLAFCAELRYDDASADRFYSEAAALDPEGFAPPPRLSEDDFVAEARAAIVALPEQFQEVLAECQIEIVPVPTYDLAHQGDPVEVAPDILGLFTGVSLLERSHDGEPQLPPVIYLFQRNLERACRDVDQLGLG